MQVPYLRFHLRAFESADQHRVCVSGPINHDHVRAYDFRPRPDESQAKINIAVSMPFPRRPDFANRLDILYGPGNSHFYGRSGWTGRLDQTVEGAAIGSWRFVICQIHVGGFNWEQAN